MDGELRELGEAIRAARMRKGLTQEALAYRRVVRRELSPEHLLAEGFPASLLTLSPEFETESGGIILLTVTVPLDPGLTQSITNLVQDKKEGRRPFSIFLTKSQAGIRWFCVNLRLLGVQHMFAMFGATILVPIIVSSAYGLPLSIQTTLFFAGVGTLFFHLCSKRQ